MKCPICNKDMVLKTDDDEDGDEWVEYYWCPDDRYEISL